MVDLFMKILTVIGARPQFIKAAAFSRLIAQEQNIEEIIVHTGQHYDTNMSNIFFEELHIPVPNYYLGIGDKSHGAMTGQQLEKIEEILISERPDWVLVYGDTNSTLAGALAAVKLHIPVAHIEAGLRSFNKKMPEEINRILTDHISTMLFCPSEASRENLLREGIASEKIHVVGDVMYDAALFYKNKSKKPEWFDSLNISQDHFLLCTIHRAENTTDPEKLKSIFKGIGTSSVPIVLPLHPGTRKKLEVLNLSLNNIFIVPPVSYLEMVWLEMQCSLIVTDSGGVQKEAFFHKKPCITLREETEWTELVHGKWNVLVGSDASAIELSLKNAVTPIDTINYYGDGAAVVKILGLLK